MKFKSVYPPVCVHGPVSNKWYVITDGIWHQVSRNYPWSELQTMWEKVNLYVDKTKGKVNPKVDKQEWIVEGSKGKKYSVVNNGGYWSCGCPAHAFGRGKDCKHITQIKSKL